MPLPDAVAARADGQEMYPVFLARVQAGMARAARLRPTWAPQQLDLLWDGQVGQVRRVREGYRLKPRYGLRSPPVRAGRGRV